MSVINYIKYKFYDLLTLKGFVHDGQKVDYRGIQYLYASAGLFVHPAVQFLLFLLVQFEQHELKLTF